MGWLYNKYGGVLRSCVSNGSWLAVAELGAHPPAILRVVAALKQKETVVEGAACTACWIWRQLCVGLRNNNTAEESKMGNGHG